MNSRDSWIHQGLNSRTPGGVRQTAIDKMTAIHQFQFTHPGRGATAQRGDLIHPRLVSIHAPREGCDEDNPKLTEQEWLFQFTHPGRGATGI